MTGTRRHAIEQREATERSDRALWALIVMTAVSGLLGLVGYLRPVETAWPKAFAFGWFAVFATGLAIELVRRRRAARLGAAAGDPSRPVG